MTTAWELLEEKFTNFKQFIEENADQSKTEALETYRNMTTTQIYLFAKVFLKPSTLDDILNTMVEKTGVQGDENIQKLKQYLECFMELIKEMSEESWF